MELFISGFAFLGIMYLLLNVFSFLVALFSPKE